MTDDELKIAGTLLYACEGTKKRRDFRSKDRYIYSIELTNSDPKIIRLFVRFMKVILLVDWQRVRGQLFIYPDLDSKKLVSFWSKASEIPESQFQKVIVLKEKLGKFKANPLGTFKIRYSCKNDFIKLEEMTEKLWRDAGVV